MAPTLKNGCSGWSHVQQLSCLSQGLELAWFTRRTVAQKFSRTAKQSTGRSCNCKCCRLTRERTELHLVDKGNAVSGVWEFADPKFRSTWWPNTNAETLPVVQCLPLSEIMQEHVGQDRRVYTPNAAGKGHYYFDFFSLDVEGAEWPVIQSIDWEHTAFGIIFMEANGMNKLDEGRIISFLQEKGYHYLRLWERSNWFFHGDFHHIYENL